MKHTRERLLFLIIITFSGCGPIITFNKYAPQTCRSLNSQRSKLIRLACGYNKQVGKWKLICLKWKLTKSLQCEKKLKITKVYLLTIFMSAQVPLTYPSGASLIRRMYRAVLSGYGKDPNTFSLW